jgi:enoyl-CoA hydratase/carnithine racemase
MTDWQKYAQRFTRAELRRDDGVLEITLHDGNGASLVWDEPAHRELPQLFREVAADPGNRVVILTGAGETFCASQAHTGWPEMNPEGWDKIFTEGRQLLANLLAIEAPMIAAINGPATWHAELAVLCDIVLAAENAYLQDQPHFPHAVPGDGVHTVWPVLLGPSRGRYFLLTSEKLEPEEAKRLGVVHEVHPAGVLMERARELARQLAQTKPLVLKYSRLALTQQLKRAVLDDLPYGLLLEGLAALDR